MPLPSSGPISLADIQTEFGGANPIGINEYYAGGAYVPAGTSGTNGAVPSSGTIAINQFYGTQSIIPRGLWMGGVAGSLGNYSNTIAYITITSTGNSVFFGNLTIARSDLAGAASGTRAIAFGGNAGSRQTRMDYVTIASTGNATTYGTLATAVSQNVGCNSSTLGFSCTGSNNSSGASSEVVSVTIASTGNGSSFASLTTATNSSAACSSSATNTALVAAGSSAGGTQYGMIQAFNMSSGSVTSTWAFLVANNDSFAGCGSTTRGLFGGGRQGSTRTKVIQYVTFASAGNATTFGDLTQQRNGLGALSSSTRAVFGGGLDVPYGVVLYSIMDYVTIASTGNAVSYGSLYNSVIAMAAVSNVNGGL